MHGAVERVANTLFGRWAAREVLRENWDAVVVFSGIAEDIFRGLGDSPTLKVLKRCSSHIRAQQEILAEEERRVGTWVEKPTNWIVAREEREYALADQIVLLSSGFAWNSFIERQVDPSKLALLRLGVQTSKFRASPTTIDERCRRILAGEPLRVINVGTFCCRKGARDYVDVIRGVDGTRFSFRFVGPVASDARHLARDLAGAATFVGKRPMFQLPLEYQWGDLFLLPTIEDGFPVVLNQALASGIPVITTPNCSGPDIIHDGQGGWIVPIRSPEVIIERLRWCDQHREELVAMVRAIYEGSWSFDWEQTAQQAEENYEKGIQRKRMLRHTEGRAPHEKPVSGLTVP
jgi:glycosyltransferase involved in cell wall biosynthesis